MANIVSLANVRRHLRFKNPDTPSSEDVSLQWFIDAADQVIEFECDEILPKTITESHDGGDLIIFTRRVPILSVLNVEEGWGYINYELDQQEVNSPGPFSMFAYSVESYEAGQISRRSSGNVQIPFVPGTGNVQVQYRAGVEKIPGAIFLAELELVAHWYQNSQLRAVSLAGTNTAYDAVEGALYSRDTESGIQNINLGVPSRILEMLKSHRHRPIIA